jgi:hypothetical protein
LSKQSSNNFSSDYYQRSIQQLQHSIISQCDGERAASKFAHDHIEIEEFREMIIEQAIAAKDYDKALKLCLEGEKKDADRRGVLRQWQQLRYRIYEFARNINGQKELGYELTISGDFDYYVKLRKLYPEISKTGENWQQVLDKIIAVVTKANYRDIYTKILIHEKMKPELLEYCKKYFAYIPRYYLHLLPDYQGEVNGLFLELIRKQSAESRTRNEYKEICGLIEKYEQACGNENAIDIILELKLSYAKRPAFIDELGKCESKMK